MPFHNRCRIKKIKYLIYIILNLIKTSIPEILKFPLKGIKIIVGLGCLENGHKTLIAYTGREILRF